jgi:hypothetical protein
LKEISMNFKELEVPCDVVNSSFKEFKRIYRNLNECKANLKNFKEFKGI